MNPPAPAINRDRGAILSLVYAWKELWHQALRTGSAVCGLVGCSPAAGDGSLKPACRPSRYPCSSRDTYSISARSAAEWRRDPLAHLRHDLSEAGRCSFAGPAPVSRAKRLGSILDPTNVALPGGGNPGPAERGPHSSLQLGHTRFHQRGPRRACYPLQSPPCHSISIDQPLLVCSMRGYPEHIRRAVPYPHPLALQDVHHTRGITWHVEPTRAWAAPAPMGSAPHIARRMTARTSIAGAAMRARLAGSRRPGET